MSKWSYIWNMLKHFNLRHLFTFLELWTKVCKSLNKFDDGFQQTTIHNKGKNEFIPTEFPPFIQFNWCMHFSTQMFLCRNWCTKYSYYHFVWNISYMTNIDIWNAVSNPDMTKWLWVYLAKHTASAITHDKRVIYIYIYSTSLMIL